MLNQIWKFCTGRDFIADKGGPMRWVVLIGLMLKLYGKYSY